MERPRPQNQRISVNAYGVVATELRRVAALLPNVPLNNIGLRALRAGLPLVERELIETAQRIVAAHDAEGL